MIGIVYTVRSLSICSSVPFLKTLAMKVAYPRKEKNLTIAFSVVIQSGEVETHVKIFRAGMIYEKAGEKRDQESTSLDA